LKKFVAMFLVLTLFSFCFKTNAVSVSAKAAIVITGDSGEIIYQKNANEKLPMASTTKIMTGLLLCEHGNFEREITVTAEMLKVEGSSMGLLAGDKVTLHDLLYGLMLASGNDAANVIAWVLGGSVSGFVDMMNQKAKELQLSNTHFATPSGLDDVEHYTTAYDLAKLACFAMKNEEFAKVVSSQKAVLNYGNPPYRRSLSNHNKMLKMYDGAVGIKTGFTKKSGRCLVTAAKRDGKYVIAVTLNAPNDWEDHKKLLDFGLSSIEKTKITPLVNNYNIPIINGQKSSLRVEIEPFEINSLQTENIDYQIELPKFLYAPVKKGEVVGKVLYFKEQKPLGEVLLYSKCDIALMHPQRNTFKMIFQNIKYIFFSI